MIAEGYRMVLPWPSSVKATSGWQWDEGPSWELYSSGSSFPVGGRLGAWEFF